MKASGYFISFEGLEGAGKSTAIQACSQILRSSGIEHIITREPGGTALGDSLRHLLLHTTMHPLTETLLFQAARIEHLEHTIKPALREGRWVLCDRFIDSTYAYQGFGRNISLDVIEFLAKQTLDLLKPFTLNLTFYLKISPEIGLQRSRHPNKFEQQGLAFHQKVEQGFFSAQQRTHNRDWITLDTEKLSIEETTTTLSNYLMAIAKKNQKKLSIPLTQQ